ncbi:MAG: metallophosphoesterase [Verrucomicrobia bacterium]|nr:metallophosphoesterase [Verrucomicrobiota bacterium]
MLNLQEIRQLENGRIIIIGDVHGCAIQLQQLLDRVNPGKNDQVLFVGDLVNKGPDSNSVIDLAKTVNARCLMGNHERRLLRYRRQGDVSALKRLDVATALRLRKSDWAYLDECSDVFVLPEYQTLVVHAGFLPVIPWQQQDLNIITEIQVLGEDGVPARRTQFPDAALWADYWQGPEFVIFGHTPLKEVYRQPFALGIDTGCVYGGKLTAFIFPEGRIVQVNGRKKPDDFCEC